MPRTRTPDPPPLLCRGRFADPRRERAFRRRAFAADRRQFRHLLVALGASLAFFGVLDVVFYHDGQGNGTSLAARALILAATAGLAGIVHRARSPRTLDRAAVALMVLVAVGLVAITTVRPVGWSPVSVLNVLTIIAAYALVPVPTRVQVGPAVGFSLVCVALLVHQAAAHPLRWVIAVAASYVLANVVGLLVSLWTGRARRRQHHLLERERCARRRLQTALSELRILRGIVPICSYCKRVRTEEGSFESVEQYVGERSEAAFSHTVCPDCLTEHFPRESVRILGR